MPSMTLQADKLNALVQSIFRAAGSNEREAKLVADHLVLANLSGHDSHGVGMIPQYMRNIQGGRAFLNRKARIVNDAGAVVTVDGGMGLGQVMAYEATEIGIERARKHGIALMGLRNSFHIGRIGHWAEQCARAGLVSTHYVNVTGHRGLVAPFGGTDARFGTNPYCAALPTQSGEPIVLDFATSRVAMGKVRVAMNKGEQVGPDILLDSAGKPTRDPRAMYTEPFGAILAFGEHKGSGLAIVAELMSGALTGGGTLPGMLDRDTIINCMLSIIFDPTKLGGGDYLAEIERFVEWVKQSPRADGVDKVRVPGEPERERRKRFGAEGITIDATTWSEIVATAESVGIKAEF